MNKVLLAGAVLCGLAAVATAGWAAWQHFHSNPNVTIVTINGTVDWTVTSPNTRHFLTGDLAILCTHEQSLLDGLKAASTRDEVALKGLGCVWADQGLAVTRITPDDARENNKWLVSVRGLDGKPMRAYGYNFGFTTLDGKKLK